MSRRTSRVLDATLALLALSMTVTGECPDVVWKAGWNAAPVDFRENLTIPVPYVVIHHTYIPGACNTTEECSRSMRSMQRYHQSKGWYDIGYNFLIGGDSVYEGRGWDIVGAHSPKYNYMSIGIAFIGDYRTELPSETMLNLSKSLIQCGIDRGSLQSNYTLLGHRQVRPTECPGDALYQEIQSWPHWDPMTDIVPRDPEEKSDTNVLLDILANSTESNVSQEGCPNVVSKEEWKATPVNEQKNLTIPVPYVIIHHTAIPGACNTTAECSNSVRSMQRYHQSLGWPDIGYNFIIGGDNQVYEGRGWDVTGGHSRSYNNKSIGIAFIGDYTRVLPTQTMLRLSKSLIQCGVDRGSIKSDYKLLGHRQVRPTESPGDALYHLIQTWPHWDPMRDLQRGNKTQGTDASTLLIMPRNNSDAPE